MFRAVITALILVLTSASADALSIRFGFASFELRQSGLLGGNFFGENLQTRFEDRFDDLMAEYEDGLEAIEDFFASEEYTEVVDDVATLIDRHDAYLDRLERRVDGIDDVISFVDQRIQSLEDLLMDFQDNEELAESRLLPLDDLLQWRIDHLGGRIDDLRERQADLDEFLPNAVTFNDELLTYFDQISTAGSPADDFVDDEPVESATSSTAFATSVTAVNIPEPATWALFVAFGVPMICRRLRVGADAGLM
ncbi:MAG: hypothetical protein AAGD11_09270 [Planctomycetota bacterium]